jgi:hypothetical protein
VLPGWVGFTYWADWGDAVEEEEWEPAGYEGAHDETLQYIVMCLHWHIIIVIDQTWQYSHVYYGGLKIQT